VSFIAANAGTAPPRGEGVAEDLKLRLLSALVLAPIAIAALVWSATGFGVLMGVTGMIMAWEWDRLRTGRFGVTGWIAAIAVVAAAGFSLAGMIVTAAVLALGAAAFGYCAVRLTDRRDAKLAALGILVAVTTASSLIWLRSIPDAGLPLAGWLIGTVWATDIGAYAAGKSIGGPRLAPRVSPGKTWAGLAGGVVLAAVWGAAFAVIWKGGIGHSAALAGVGAVLAQMGDLVISAVKRHYGAKDSSHIIPGHGGVLDRIAGLVITGPLMASMVAIGSFAPWR